MKTIKNLISEFKNTYDYNEDAFYMDMFDDPMVKYIETKLDRQITDEEAEFIFENA